MLNRGAFIIPVMIVKQLSYVPLFVHRGRCFPSSTGILKARSLFVICGTSGDRYGR